MDEALMEDRPPPGEVVSSGYMASAVSHHADVVNPAVLLLPCQKNLLP